MLFDPFCLKPYDLIGFQNLDEINQFVDTLIESGVPFYFGTVRSPLSEIPDYIRRNMTFPLTLYLEDGHMNSSYFMVKTGDLEPTSESFHKIGFTVGNQYQFGDLLTLFPVRPDDDLPAIDLSKFLK